MKNDSDYIKAYALGYALFRGTTAYIPYLSTSS